MPCRSDYLEPNEREEQSRYVCVLLGYLLKAMGQEVPESITKAANSIYGNINSIDKNTAWLCELCNDLSEKEKAKYIYDGRNANARKLADWWESHLEWDKKRKLEKKNSKKNIKLREQALQKLTKEEIKALELD